MNLQLIRTFVTFIESDGMAETARKLSLTQPAITHQLKALESELAQELFVYRGKRKVPTALGMEFYEKMKHHLRELEASWAQFKQVGMDPKNLELRFGGRKEIMEDVVERVSFKGKMSFLHYGSEEAYEKLLAHEIDMAILSFRPKHQRLICKKFVTIGLKWFSKKEIKAKDLKSEKIYEIPLIAYSSKLPFLTEWCKHHHLDPKKLQIKGIIDNWYMVKHLCLRHDALAIVPENVLLFQEFDRDSIGSQIIPEVEFFYAYHEGLKSTLKKGDFALDAI